MAEWGRHASPWADTLRIHCHGLWHASGGAQKKQKIRHRARRAPVECLGRCQSPVRGSPVSCLGCPVSGLLSFLVSFRGRTGDSSGFLKLSRRLPHNFGPPSFCCYLLHLSHIARSPGAPGSHQNQVGFRSPVRTRFLRVWIDLGSPFGILFGSIFALF